MYILLALLLQKSSWVASNLAEQEKKGRKKQEFGTKFFFLPSRLDFHTRWTIYIINKWTRKWDENRASKIFSNQVSLPSEISSGLVGYVFSLHHTFVVQHKRWKRTKPIEIGAADAIFHKRKDWQPCHVSLQLFSGEKTCVFESEKNYMRGRGERKTTLNLGHRRKVQFFSGRGR